MATNKKLSTKQQTELLKILETRFSKNMKRHKNIDWPSVQTKLIKNPEKLWRLNEMELTGGEPDVIDFNTKTTEYIFCDCSAETPKGRRSVCYDRAALDARKEFKPANSAMDMATTMGIEMLTEEQYRVLQQFGSFDTKTSSWLKTPNDIRKLDGAIFGDFRFERVFIYHNGVQSYYAGRGFRGLLKV